MKGTVYQISISEGEIATPQKQLAIIGSGENYLLELQIDEYDIVNIQLGMPIFMVLNSYRDSVFNALVTKIKPIMNVQTKTFTVEAAFVRQPSILYPNISFEANIVTSTKFMPC